MVESERFSLKCAICVMELRDYPGHERIRFLGCNEPDIFECAIGNRLAASERFWRGEYRIVRRGD